MRGELGKLGDLPRMEWLEGIFDGKVTHAIYPSAPRPLCLKKVYGHWVRSPERPTCRICRVQIMRSAFFSTQPRHWRPA